MEKLNKQFQRRTFNAFYMEDAKTIPAYFVGPFSIGLQKGLSKKATCLRGRVAEWLCGRVAEINFG